MNTRPARRAGRLRLNRARFRSPAGPSERTRHAAHIHRQRLLFVPLFLRYPSGHGPYVARPLWPLRRALRRRNAHPRSRRARCRLPRSTRRRGLRGRAHAAAQPLRGARDAALLRAQAFRRGGHARLAEARRPVPHGRAQDQQHHRPGAARAPHGQAPHHRRDGRGPAWCGHGHGLRAVRPGLRGVHGCRGRQASGAQRAAHASPGSQGARGAVGLEDAQRRHERGHARLGHQCAHHVLLRGQRRRAAPLPEHRARLSAHHRRRGARAAARAQE
jgi:hypothetical protein